MLRAIHTVKWDNKHIYQQRCVSRRKNALLRVAPKCGGMTLEYTQDEYSNMLFTV